MSSNDIRISYKARISRQGNEGFLVEFPDLPGCLTEGQTLEEALANAKEALSGWLYVAIKKGEEIPEPKEHVGRNFYKVEPDVDVLIPLTILLVRKKKGLTQTKLANELGISQQAYRKLEVPGKSNPSVKTLARLLTVLGLKLEIASSPTLATCGRTR